MGIKTLGDASRSCRIRNTLLRIGKGYERSTQREVKPRHWSDGATRSMSLFHQVCRYWLFLGERLL